MQLKCSLKDKILVLIIVIRQENPPNWNIINGKSMHWKSIWRQVRKWFNCPDDIPAPNLVGPLVSGWRFLYSHLPLPLLPPFMPAKSPEPWSVAKLTGGGVFFPTGSHAEWVAVIWSQVLQHLHFRCIYNKFDKADLVWAAFSFKWNRSPSFEGLRKHRGTHWGRCSPVQPL